MNAAAGSCLGHNILQHSPQILYSLPPFYQQYFLSIGGGDRNVIHRAKHPTAYGPLSCWTIYESLH